ncbi:WD domain, G-beta repeat [Rhizoctonia solani]|uniref:WD domain, G-beta repeat n=1 Tax=Rhizoctonia solani TaxID=456999 RepID=A0A8H7ILJ5_9AGAM|nr:WD domain, G-beta repeat [Rhizoctonia solani]
MLLCSTDTLPYNAPQCPTPKRRKLSAVTEDEVGTFSPSSSSTTSNTKQTSHERVEGISGAKRIKKNSAWTGLEAALQGLRISSSSFPTLQSAIGTLTTCLEVFEQQASTHEDEYEALALELESVVTSLKHHLNIPRSARVLGVISTVSRAIEKEVHLISDIRDGGSTRRIFARQKMKRSSCESIAGSPSCSPGCRMLIMTQNTRLEALSPSKQARCDSNLGDEIGRRQCTEGTRESLLADLYQWSDSLDDKPVYLMSGIAGTGKTTIAYSLAKLLEDDSRLGASFFCTRAAASCKDASRIIPSIAYQLARYSTAFQSALCLVLDADPDLGSRNMTTQFKRLLREPLLQVKDKIPKHTVVVLDALDECDNLKATRLLFDLIIRSACELPIKFFAASRPESRIQLMSSQVNDIVHISHLHEIESSLVKRDLEVYLHEELACIKPSQQQINQLAELANNLFVYAATAVRYIRSDEAGVYSNERLFTILNETKYTSKKFSEIDELYTTILTSALENKRLEPEEATRTKLY